ncbi:hypothetical protein [Curtobacterium luteum]|uniref:Uncharacterized protein n=1 Tax=Curtobacterium luteum TaxID=33881 RepID=A0A175RYE2_9MICO|nr:hypothetical protein [Curtobacterium luteum]KTR08786.1 hypothetical protein NS184_04480 [Curtobacterium luteum]
MGPLEPSDDRDVCGEPADERHEWHRRGMLHPADIEALVHRRLVENLPHEPVYADFFGPVSRPRERDRER